MAHVTSPTNPDGLLFLDEGNNSSNCYERKILLKKGWRSNGRILDCQGILDAIHRLRRFHRLEDQQTLEGKLT